MTDFIEEYLAGAAKDDLRNVVIELQSEVHELQQRMLNVNQLDDITPEAGQLTPDELSSGIISGSEMRSFLLTSENQMAIAGAVIVSKDAGKLAVEVTDVDTTVDFGQAMTVGDWIKIQGQDAEGNSNSVEWMLIGALIEDTTYNVTRDVDGSGASKWAVNTPFVVVGQVGDSRIELVAGATGTLALITQGATWNAYTTQTAMSTVEGAIIAGAGNVRLDVNGETFAAQATTATDPSKIKWTYASGTPLTFYSFYNTGLDQVLGQIDVQGNSAERAAGFHVGVVNYGASRSATLDLFSPASTASLANLEADNINLYGSVLATGDVTANGAVNAKYIRASGGAGLAGYNTLTGTYSAVSSTGVGSIKLNGTTSRQNTGWIKFFVDVTPMEVPCWDSITG